MFRVRVHPSAGFPLAAWVRTKRGETAWRVESSSGMIPQLPRLRLHDRLGRPSCQPSNRIDIVRRRLSATKSRRKRHVRPASYDPKQNHHELNINQEADFGRPDKETATDSYLRLNCEGKVTTTAPMHPAQAPEGICPRSRLKTLCNLEGFGFRVCPTASSPKPQKKRTKALNPQTLRTLKPKSPKPSKTNCPQVASVSRLPSSTKTCSGMVAMACDQV